MITILDTKQDYLRVYERLRAGRRDETLLYSVPNPSFGTFYDLVYQGWGIELSYDVPSTVAWIDTFNGKTAFVHFSTYAGAEHNTVRSMVDVLDWAFNVGQRTTVFGITPKPYRHVFKAVTGPAGFEVILEEPEMCYIAKRDKYVSGIITRLTHSKWLESRKLLVL